MQIHSSVNVYQSEYLYNVNFLYIEISNCQSIKWLNSPLFLFIKKHLEKEELCNLCGYYVFVYWDL